MSTIQRRYLDTQDGQLHYRERSGSGTPIVFLHQTASSSIMWERVMGIYPEGRRLIALDTPGFGLSDGPPAYPEDGLTYYARRVVDFLDGLELDVVNVVGHHTGTMVALELALIAPERIRRQFLIGAVLLTPAEGQQWMAEHVNRWVPDSRGDFVTEVLLPRMARSVTTDDPEHLLRELTAYLEAGPQWWWAYQAVFSYDGPARIPQVSVSTRLAAGADEAPDMLTWTRQVAELIPGADYLELTGLGAEVAFQAPAETSEAIHGYLEALDED